MPNFFYILTFIVASHCLALFFFLNSPMSQARHCEEIISLHVFFFFFWIHFVSTKCPVNMDANLTKSIYFRGFVAGCSTHSIGGNLGYPAR